VHTRGANGVFFLEILDRRHEMVKVRNNPAAGRSRDLPRIEAWIESSAIRPLLRGEDVQRTTAQPGAALLFFHDAEHLSRPLAKDDASLRFPKAFEFAKQFETFLRSRHPFRNFNPAGEDWLGIYSVTQAAISPHKVVFREISQLMIAAALHSSDIIPDHKLYVIRCTSAAEADWLAEVMNSDLVDRLAHAFAVSTSISGSLLRYIGITNLADNAVPVTAPQRLERALGLRRPQVERLRRVLSVDLEPPESSSGTLE
jgi:hypothetical protein